MDEKYLNEVAQGTGREWKKLGVLLGFPWAKVNQFQLNQPVGDVKNIVFSMLVQWNQGSNRNPRQSEDLLKKAIQLSHISLPFEPSLEHFHDDTFLYQVAEHLGSSWKNVGRELRISESQLQQLEIDNRMSTSDCAMDMLFKWRSAKGVRRERLSKLLEAISKNGNKEYAKKLLGCIAREIEPSEIELSSAKDGGFLVLGSGGFGEVFKAQYKRFQENVAVKIIHSKTIMPEEITKPLLREVWNMTMLRNTYIVHVFGMLLDEVERRYGIVMEFMVYGSVREVLEKALVPQSVKTKLVVDMYKGMAFIHGENMIHRDLKAANVLIGANFEAKISDLGQAKIVTITQTVTKKGPSSTTATHRAPEMFDDDYVSGPPADVWSSGIVLFEIQAEKQRDSSSICKRVPFNENTSNLKISTKVFLKKQNPISEVQISEKLADDTPDIFIRQMKSSTAISPDERPTFPELLEELNAYFMKTFSGDVHDHIENLKIRLSHGDEEYQMHSNSDDDRRRNDDRQCNERKNDSIEEKGGGHRVKQEGSEEDEVANDGSEEDRVANDSSEEYVVVNGDRHKDGVANSDRHEDGVANGGRHADGVAELISGLFAVSNFIIRLFRD